jgi:hypothetical protein
VLLGLSGVAQESTAPSVAIPIIARGSHHRPISVTVESLVITDQKTPISGASLLEGTNLPLELGVLIDTSNSQREGLLGEILKSMNRFIPDTLRGPQDRVFVLNFEATSQATGWLKKEQLQTFTIPIRIGGGTALYDALVMAGKERMGPRDWRKPTRRMLVLVSDGEDNLSYATRDDRGEKIMEYWAKLTGGESFSRLSRSDIPKVFTNIKELIEGMHYLRYLPPDASKSAIHEVEVKPAPKEKFELSYARRYPWNP